jgi:hypothetical protein
MEYKHLPEQLQLVRQNDLWQQQSKQCLSSQYLSSYICFMTNFKLNTNCMGMRWGRDEIRKKKSHSQIQFMYGFVPERKATHGFW